MEVWVLTEDLKQIAYKEGYREYDYISVIDNPYDGVNRDLYEAWNDGWFDAFDDE
jgi:hypothetical protein